MAKSFDQAYIRKILPQKPPFLFIDRVTEFAAGQGLSAVKEVTANDLYAVDQADGSRIFPQTLMIEAAAQAASFFVYQTLVERGSPENRTIVLGKIKADIKEAAEAGDVLQLKVLSGKIMASGGYADVELAAGEKRKLGETQVFYSFLK